MGQSTPVLARERSGVVWMMQQERWLVADTPAASDPANRPWVGTDAVEAEHTTPADFPQRLVRRPVVVYNVPPTGCP